MENPLVRKLQSFVKLSAEDVQVLDSAALARVRTFGPREDIISEGDKPHDLYLVLSGWSCRYKQLEDGRRQILSFFVPGDLCDLNMFILREMDHSIGTITATTVAELSRQTIEVITLGHARITQALWWETLVNSGIQREWTVNIGQRTALERIAHLFCELFIRLDIVGLTSGKSFEFPVTQAELADATGLSTVHVNRTLRELREARLVEWKGKIVTIPDLDALANVALFNPNYLHLEREGRHLDAND
jgi:CRP-like cAMP-binding protein